MASSASRYLPMVVGDIRHIQTLHGHSSLETTKIYLRMVPGHLS